MNQCPVCSGEMKCDVNRVGNSILEETRACPAGCYSYEIFYGQTTVRVGKREWVWSWITAGHVESHCCEQIKAALVEARKAIGAIVLGPRVWSEDDAAPDAESIHEAWQRLFGEPLDVRRAARKEDWGDCDLHLMPNGHVAVTSYPGNSAIYRADQ